MLPPTGLANADAAGYVRLWAAARAGDMTGAVAEQERLNRLFEIAFQTVGRSGDAGGVGAFKVAMVAIGLIGSDRMALPIRPFDAESIARIRAIVQHVGLLPATRQRASATHGSAHAPAGRGADHRHRQELPRRQSGAHLHAPGRASRPGRGRGGCDRL